VLNNIRIFAVLQNIMRWIATDPDRPGWRKLLPPLLLIMASPIFAALSFVLLPAAILRSPPPPFVLDALRHYGLSTTSTELQPLWSDIVIVAAPILFMIHAALTYVGRRRILQLSMQFQRALTRRVARQFTEDNASISERSSLSAETARKLMLADARYLGRAFLSLASTLPSLATTLMSFAVLAWLVPWIVLILFLILLLFFPVQGFVATQGQAHSDGYLAAGAKYGSFLSRSLRAFLMLPFPKRLDTKSFGETITGEEGEGFFANFEGRTRIGYFGDLWGGVTVALMLFALLLTFDAFPELRGDLTPELAILILVAARYFFAGMRSTLQTVVGLGNTYPYYRGYMTAIVRPKHPGARGASAVAPAHPPSPAADPGLAAGHALRLAVGETVGIVDANGQDPWETLSRLEIIFSGFDHAELRLTDEMIVRASVDIEDYRTLGATRNIDFKQVSSRYPASLGSLSSVENIIELISGMDGLQAAPRPTEMLLIALAIALGSEETRVVIIGQRQLRLVKEAHRKQICGALTATGIAILVVSDDGVDFLTPKPARFVAIGIEPGGTDVRLKELNIEDANAFAFGTDIGRMSLRDGEYVGILAEYSPGNWRSVRAALSSGSAGTPAKIKVVASLGPEIFRPYLQVAGIAPDQFAASLTASYPKLRDWWSSVARAVQVGADSSSARTNDGPTDEFRCGLAYALSNDPHSVVISASAFNELAADDRILLIAALKDAKKAVLLWNDGGVLFSEPLPSRVVHIRPDGKQYRSFPDPRAKLPRPTREARSAEDVVVRLPEGKREIKVAQQVGVVVNQSTMSWNEVGHFVRIARKATDLFERPATIVAPALFTNAAAFPLLRADAAAIDLSGLTISYPGLIREWWSLLPYLEALRKGAPDLEPMMADASAATHFWLAMAFALNGDARLVFVRERDFRLVPQNARARLIASIAAETLVVWKDNLSLPFVEPQPANVLLAGNSRIISVAGPHVLWQDLDVETRRAVFRDSFASPITDPTAVLAEEEA
jgi:ABC-type multidrug transport system fused ATPase/permease subunit